MTPVRVEESGLVFGPFADDDCFPVERSGLCSALQPGIKMVEFMLVRAGANDSRDVWCVEAKSSIAQPGTRPSFQEQIEAIGEKMCNALLVLLALHAGRHAAFAHEVPASFRTLRFDSDGVRFILVINGHRRAWLQPV